MNETIKTILNRRSCRAYKTEQITKDELNAIIECGLWAPSTVNCQEWHFTVIQNDALISRMNEEIKPKLPQAARERMMARNGGKEDFSIFYHAPTVIMVSGAEKNGSSPMNVSFATENICLAAESFNIGSCIIGMATMLFDGPNGGEYKAELGIPEGYKPFYAICLGYKNMTPVKPDRAGSKVNVIE